MRKLLAAGVLLVLALRPAHAIFVDGYQLSMACQGVDESFCLGFILGVTDAIELAHLPDPGICIPYNKGDARGGQIQMVVKRYLETRPQELHVAAAVSVAAALREAFPCKKRAEDLPGSSVTRALDPGKTEGRLSGGGAPRPARGCPVARPGFFALDSRFPR
jgi:Rap1a immunity proteins